ncbi:class I tRNA ligase family protein [Actinomadura sp. BRA 177]|uniref:class I tRNA ligase family protein n=1 Tax=Actinomadura sp. BRA 177 TaxID=2745202 RepID=UPI0015952C27|nr:class I tRNA ligase family protein [Actinomadura sp. BRA 177]NVI88272.1 class I tRNA ligase family protein [Actinomadura sp. BRA 177]
MTRHILALDYGSDGAEFRRWWTGGARRVHLVGKGVLRFHAVYWPAMLLSAGLPVPDEVLVHGYLTAGGRKISKSGDVTVEDGGRRLHRGAARRAAKAGDPRLDTVLAGLVAACRMVGELLGPFLPDVAGRVRRQCGGQRLPTADPVFRRVGCPREATGVYLFRAVYLLLFG